MNYLISVWSEKNVLVYGRNSKQNKSQSCLETKFEVVLLNELFFNSPFKWSEPHFFFQTDNITCSKDMNLHFGRRCIIRNAFKNAWIGCAGILHQQMNCGLSGFFCYDLRKQMKCIVWSGKKLYSHHWIGLVQLSYLLYDKIFSSLEQGASRAPQLRTRKDLVK